MCIYLSLDKLIIDKGDIPEYIFVGERSNEYIKQKLDAFYKCLEEEKENESKYRKRKERE